MKRHGELERVLSRWRRSEASKDSSRTAPTGPASTELLAEQIKHLRAEVDELRGRVNGLLFTVIGAVVVQLVLRLLE
jgi:hypothetical protein